MFDFNIVKRNRRRSSEAPAILNTNATYNFKQQQLSRRRSLDSTSHVSNINLLPSVSGITTSTAIKKLIEEIEGIEREREREREGTKFMDFNSSFILKNKTVILRFVSLTIIFIKSLIRASDKNTNTHYLSCYIIFFLFLELALIFLWKSRDFGAEIKNKLRQIQRALLSDSITIDELYDTPVLLYIYCLIMTVILSYLLLIILSLLLLPFLQFRILKFLCQIRFQMFM